MEWKLYSDSKPTKKGSYFVIYDIEYIDGEPESFSAEVVRYYPDTGQWVISCRVSHIDNVELWCELPSFETIKSLTKNK